MKLVELTAPDGMPVEINPDQVVAVRPAAGQYDLRALTVIILESGLQAVREDIHEVAAKLEQ